MVRADVVGGHANIIYARPTTDAATARASHSNVKRYIKIGLKFNEGLRFKSVIVSFDPEPSRLTVREKYELSAHYVSGRDGSKYPFPTFESAVNYAIKRMYRGMNPL